MADSNELYVMTPRERKEAKCKARAERRAARRPFPAVLRVHLSLFYLSVRRRALAVVGIAALMTGAEALLFWLTLRGEVAQIGNSPAPRMLETVVTESGMLYAFLVAYLLLTALLCGLMMPGRHRTDYTVRRLSVKKSTYYIWQAVFAAVCFGFLAMVQILFVFFAGRWYASALSAQNALGISDLNAVLLFYENDFLHGLLPLADGTRLVASGSLLIGLSVAVAHAEYGRWHRRGRLGAAMAILVFSVMFSVPMGRPGQDFIITLPVVVLFTVLMVRRWYREVKL